MRFQKLVLLIQLVMSAAAPLLAQPSFGMIGIGYNQTLRLNIIAYPSIPCMAQLNFVNAAGVQVGPSTTVNLSAGQGALPLDLNSSLFGLQSGQRIQVRPVVNVISTGGTASQCLATAEIVDNATANSLVEYAAGAGIPPGVTPAYGLHGVSLSPGQVMRLNTVAFPTGPCHAQLTFQVSGGYVGPIPNVMVSLSPGQASSIDFNPNFDTLPVFPGQRISVLPIVVPQDTVSTCTPTAEVIAPTTANTQTSTTPPTSISAPSFGAIGLAANQTIQLNIRAYPADSCLGQMAFFNSGGTQMTPWQAFSLSAGQGGAPLPFFPQSPVIPAGQRMEFHPVVEVSSGACLATTEAFDNSSGASRVEVPATAPAALGVAPTYGIHGVAAGQLLRLNITATDSEHYCRATLSFTNPITGQTIGPSPTSFALPPGQSASLDFNPASIGIASGQRIQVHPVISLINVPGINGSGIASCTATAEVYDAASGTTSAWTHKTTPALVCPGEPAHERGQNSDDSCKGQ